MEIEIRRIPFPLRNYANLIIERKSPYFDLIKYIVKEMEFHYKRAGKSEIVYIINPRVLQEEIEKKIKDEKLTTLNISRTILASSFMLNLKKGKDFWVTTTSGGKKNYHFRINQKVLNSFSRLII